MVDVATIAQAHRFIMDKTDGYQSQVSQGGQNVSGGQRQRIAIARALASKPKILLFDDSFSALDYRTEHLVRNKLKQHLTATTVIIVAQRISSILQADKILVVDEGRLVGQGTHASLMETCEVYRQIARSQLSLEEMDHYGG
jgi:ATP-binding cassette subfamily B protein